MIQRGRKTLSNLYNYFLTDKAHNKVAYNTYIALLHYVSYSTCISYTICLTITHKILLIPYSKFIPSSYFSLTVNQIRKLLE